MNRILDETRDSVTCAICTDVFDDPRILKCSHSFCLHCLIEFRGRDDGDAEKFCPICREPAVPPIDQLQYLPQNEFAKKVAGLIKDQERPAQPSAPSPGEADSALEDNGDFYMGKLIEKPKKKKKGGAGLGIGLSVIAGVAVTALTGGLGGVLAGLAVAGIGTAGSIDADKKMKQSYQCSGCQKNEYSSIRFKCGMCEDFSLCPTCFKDTDHLAQLHNAQHIFLKLKFQQRRELPHGPVLREQVDDICHSINYRSKVHGKAYVHSATRIIKLPAIKCHFCGAMPIKGNRYKCGMCPDYDLCSSCEVGSSDIHDKNHVFMVLINQSDINVVSVPLIRAHFY